VISFVIYVNFHNHHSSERVIFPCLSFIATIHFIFVG